MRFGMRPFGEGTAAVVTVKFRDEMPAGNPGFELMGSKGVKVETPPVRIQDAKSGRVEASWRVRMTEQGEHELSLQLDGGKALSKKVWVGDPSGIERISNGRYSSRDIGQAFLEPVEAPIDPKTGIRSVTVYHPAASLSFFGFWETHWLVWFCIISIVVGFALKNKFGVQI